LKQLFITSCWRVCCLLELCEQAVCEVSGTSYRMPSLHDAAEVSRAGIPAVMMFVQSLGGISHNKLEDTREDHLELSVAALDRLASKTVDWVLGGQDNALSGN
jgi:beta-ureidopropionase / N-carbamoyl-L-amino-acid hydrolase